MKPDIYFKRLEAGHGEIIVDGILCGHYFKRGAYWFANFPYLYQSKTLRRLKLAIVNNKEGGNYAGFYENV
jgi:hypothetical protein